MIRQLTRRLLVEAQDPAHVTVLPDAVARAARGVSGDAALLEMIREDWPFLEIAAAKDRFFGQQGRTDSAAYRDALAGLGTFLKWAGPNAESVKFLAYALALKQSEEPLAAHDVEAAQRLEAALARLYRLVREWRFAPSHPPCEVEVGAGSHPLVQLVQQAVQDVEAVRRLEALLTRGSLGPPRKKKKAFLPALARLVLNWHEALGAPPPELSANSAAVKLMRAIASHMGVELGPDAHRKALSARLTKKAKTNQ